MAREKETINQTPILDLPAGNQAPTLGSVALKPAVLNHDELIIFDAGKCRKKRRSQRINLEAQGMVHFVTVVRNTARRVRSRMRGVQLDANDDGNITLDELRAYIWDVTENPDLHGSVGSIVMLVMMSVIVFSTIMLAIETMPELNHVSYHVWVDSEVFCTVIFTFEYLLRYYCCPEQPAFRFLKWRFMIQLMSVVDICAIIPFYVDLIRNGGLPQSQSAYEDKGGSGIWRIFRVIRLARALRVAKMSRYSSALAAFLGTMRKAIGALVVMVFLLVLVGVFFSAVVFEFEREDNPDMFVSIPYAMWWAWITMTTVGYGDIYPITTGGKIFASLTMIIGMITIALPLTIVASQAVADFDSYITSRQQRRLELLAETPKKNNDAVEPEPVQPLATTNRASTNSVSELVGDSLRSDGPKDPQWYDRMWEFLETPSSSRAAYGWSIFVGLVIVLSCVGIVLSSMPVLSHVKSTTWDGIETFCITVFTIEYGLKWLLVPGTVTMHPAPCTTESWKPRTIAWWKLKFAFMSQLFSVIDLLAILPYYIQAANSGGRTRVFAAFRVIRLVRLIRVFKLGRHSQTVQVFIESLRHGLPALVMVGGFVVVYVVVFSSLMHEFEKDGPNGHMFKSIPNSFWWAVVTCTTVGYGDAYPATTAGRFICAIAAVTGFMGVTLPISIIGVTFAQRAEAAAIEAQRIKKAQKEARIAQLLQEYGPNATTATQPIAQDLLTRPLSPVLSNGADQPKEIEMVPLARSPTPSNEEANCKDALRRGLDEILSKYSLVTFDKSQAVVQKTKQRDSGSDLS